MKSAKALNLTLDEVSSIVRIVREVCDLWSDPVLWREHLLREACWLLNGNVGTNLAVGRSAPGQLGAIRPIAVFGLPVPEQKALVSASTAVISNRDVEETAQHVYPGQVTLWAEFNKQGWVTAARDQLTDAATYHASPGYLNFRRHADCDDFVWSMRTVDLPERIEMIGVDRPHGVPPFGPREVALLKFLHDEISPLIGVRLATEEHLCCDGLSRRLRETLSHLLDGKSEKEVAAELGLSPRTVHEYIASIYRHFKVKSRAELMAYFIRRTPILRHS